jgi:outer membrane protein assembly factor BamD (BamD/ComL family)
MTRKLVFRCGLLVLLLASVFSGAAVAQRNVTPAIDRDPILEAEAKHNLDVAWQYFKPLKKAYKSVIDRFEETWAVYPSFSQMDQFLYLAGMSSFYLSQGKGRQQVDLRNEKEVKRFAPEKLREDARTYLKLIVEKYPQSKYRDEAEKTLALLDERNPG